MPSHISELMKLLEFDHKISIADVGAATIAEEPVYANLVGQTSAAQLFLFDGDERQIEKINSKYGENATCLNHFLGDGKSHTAYICAEMSGMTSLLKPSEKALKFFNGFEKIGKVYSTEQVQTTKLDDISEIAQLHFLKMDIQGSELSVLKNGKTKLKDCMAIQLEVSYFCLYENQPTFGDIDVWMRNFGFVPHRFLDIKRWSIVPTINDGNFRKPFNQLLESDIVYIKDPLQMETRSIEQLKTLALFADLFFSSPDLVIYCLLELIKQKSLPKNITQRYITLISNNST